MKATQQQWRVGDRAWYIGDPELGDERIESQIIHRVEGTELHFYRTKRIRWIDADVAYRSREEASAALVKESSVPDPAAVAELVGAAREACACLQQLIESVGDEQIVDRLRAALAPFAEVGK